MQSPSSDGPVETAPGGSFLPVISANWPLNSLENARCAPALHISASTAPASTDASWSLSPSRMRRAEEGMAATSLAISAKSTILASSIYVELHISRLMLSNQ